MLLAGSTAYHDQDRFHKLDILGWQKHVDPLILAHEVGQDP